jgi:hypothetical protein
MRKNFEPKLNKSLICFFFTKFQDGATALKELLNRINDAIIITNIGIVETANANKLSDGGQYFVSNKIINNEMKLPMTGNAEDKATF